MGFERDQDAIFDAIKARMDSVHPDLAFEFSQAEGSVREFAVSADGMRENIEPVLALVAAAPKLANWHIVAFRQRVGAGFDLNFGPVTPSAKTIHFVEGGADDGLDIIIIHPALDGETRTATINGIYILLDSLLGEYDVITGIRGIGWAGRAEDIASYAPHHVLHPLAALVDLVDAHQRTRSASH